MTISDIGSIGEVVGAVATIGTLIYIAIQIRENTSWTKRQALESVIDRVISWGGRFNDNPDVLDIYLRGSSDFESFDETRKHRYHYIMCERLVACEAALEHEKTKAIKSESTAAIERIIRRELRGNGARAWWGEMGRELFADDFSAHIDQIIRETSPHKALNPDP